MSRLPPDDTVAHLLRRVRQRQAPQALAELEALPPDLDSPQGVALEGCRLLLQWHARPVGTHYEVGLAGAITGVSVLREEGYRPLIAWDMASVGYAMGVLGDLETGIAWLDVALEDARQLQDQRGEIFFLSHQGSLLAYAERLEAAEQVFRQALALCVDAQAPIKAGVLTSLSYAALLKARQPQTPEADTRALAQQALDLAREGLALMQGQADFARFECSALDNMAQALVLLNSPAEAEALFVDGLRKSEGNRAAQFGLLIGHAELMLQDGRLAQAAQALQQAQDQPSLHQVGPSLQRLFAARIELARRQGPPEALEALWHERQQWVEDRYRARLQRVHEQAEVQARLMRLQSQARATRLELQQAEVQLLQARLQAEQARQAERESVMLNLHDGLGSQLATARLHAQWGELGQDEMVSLLDECMADLHLVVDTLGSEDGDLGRALRLLRNRTRTRLTGAKVETVWELAVDGAPPLPAVLLTNVLRLLQEALTNALRHARAQHIVVQCRYEAAQQRLSIQVRDDGQGIPPATLGQMRGEAGAAPSSGKGLHNLVQRARRLGGELHIKALSPGTEVAFELPLPPGPPPPQEPLT